MSSALKSFRVYPATPSRWPHVERLFGERGACAGCWCMFWRRRRKDWTAGKGAGNRRAFRKLIVAGERPGLIGYDRRQPIAWCAVAPRGDYPALARSRILEPVDDRPVWSVSCLFVDRAYRKQGVSVRMLKAAVEHAGKRGGRIVEGYPVEPRGGKAPDAFVWTGLASAFLQAGFAEVARRSPTRPIMRREIRC